ncbi:plasminogen receptor (KT) [Aricia agestis]|uniref:plasminogen receptor (KT) n=1 Tax=Aricia agestis TaxID=91739 RepID=UPI001C206752|nr:plasminogen receptor (KT) [Aricia agestis]
MGSYLSINLEQQYKKNEKFIQTLNETMMERQIQMQNQMAMRQRAMAIAMNRDFFLFFGTFSAVAATALIAGFRKSRKPAFLGPLLPLTFANLYYYDMAYGSKLHRVRLEAEYIMNYHPDLLTVPCGLPSPSSIDQGRLKDEEEKLIHPPAPQE